MKPRLIVGIPFYNAEGSAESVFGNVERLSGYVKPEFDVYGIFHLDRSDESGSGYDLIKRLARESGYTALFSRGEGGKGLALRKVWCYLMGHEDPSVEVDRGYILRIRKGDRLKRGDKYFLTIDGDGQQDVVELFDNFYDGFIGNMEAGLGRTERMLPIAMPRQKVEFEGLVSNEIILRALEKYHDKKLDILRSTEDGIGASGYAGGPRDLQAGGSVIHTDTIRGFNENLVAERYAFDTEQIIIAAINGAPVFFRAREDLPEADRRDGKSHAEWTDEEAVGKLRPINEEIRRIVTHHTGISEDGYNRIAEEIILECICDGKEIPEYLKSVFL